MARSKKGLKNPLPSSGVQHTANTEDNPPLMSATSTALRNTPSASAQRRNSIVQVGNTASQSVITDPGDASIPTRDNVRVEQALETGVRAWRTMSPRNTKEFSRERAEATGSAILSSDGHQIGRAH